MISRDRRSRTIEFPKSPWIYPVPSYATHARVRFYADLIFFYFRIALACARRDHYVDHNGKQVLKDVPSLLNIHRDSSHAPARTIVVANATTVRPDRFCGIALLESRKKRLRARHFLSEDLSRRPVVRCTHFSCVNVCAFIRVDARR